MNARNAKFPRIKVGSINSLDEALDAVAAGADAIGLSPTLGGWGSTGTLSAEAIHAIARGVPVKVGTFLLCREQRLSDIVALQRRCGVNTIQLCEPFSPQSHADLQSALPGVALVQVVRLNGRTVMAQAIAAALRANALILSLPLAETAPLSLSPAAHAGGWALAAQVRRAVKVPVFLAGGLEANNVGSAIAQVSPWGVDVGRGVRRPADGKLDLDDLRAFVAAVRGPSLPDFVDRDTGPVHVSAE